MKPIIIPVNFLPATAMAIFPFVLVKKKSIANDRFIINHELIHFRQQAELLFIPFYILYFILYLINLAWFRNHDKAYRNIVFEKEAYKNEALPHYLHKRKPYAWFGCF